MNPFRITDRRRHDILKRRFLRIQRSYERTHNAVNRLLGSHWAQKTVMEGRWAKPVPRLLCVTATNIGIWLTRRQQRQLDRLDRIGLNSSFILGQRLESLQMSLYAMNNRYIQAWTNLRYGSSVPKPRVRIW